MKHTRNRRSNASREFRLPANVMQEEAWEDDGPNMKLSRAFIVVLALHIVAVAGLMAFNFFEGRPGKPSSSIATAAEPMLPQSESEVTPTIKPTPPLAESNKPVLASDPVPVSGMKPINIKSQRTTQQLAAEYGLREDDLLQMNRHVPLIKGVVLPGEVVYVPDTAIKVASFDDLDVAPVAIPPRDTMPPTSEPAREPEQTVVKSTPSKTAPPAAKPRMRERPPVAKAKPQSQPRPPKKTHAKPTPKKAVVKAKPQASSSSQSHTIGKGENLYRIGRKYGVSVDAIQKANGISDPAKIFAGQQLKIPSK